MRRPEVGRIGRAIAEAMATAKSTIVPWPDLIQ
jgi:hypothetical protein